jgi:large subunit ribosomal protein L7/L12
MLLKKPKNKENIMADEETKVEATKEETKAEVKAEAKVEEKEEKKAIPAKFKDLVDQIDKLSVLELSELVKILEDHYGVSAAAPMAVAAAPAGGGDGDAAEEKSAYTVVLAAAGDQKINVIKAVRELTGLGLAESKALVDGAPKPIKEAVPKAEADEAKAALEAAGATAELQ